MAVTVAIPHRQVQRRTACVSLDPRLSVPRELGNFVRESPIHQPSSAGAHFIRLWPWPTITAQHTTSLSL